MIFARAVSELVPTSVHLRSVQEETTSSQTGDAPDLLGWFERHANVPSAKELNSAVHFKASGKEGNGVFAKRDIAKSDVIFEVPYHMIMNEPKATARLAPLIERCKAVTTLPSLLMALYLIAEDSLGQDSFFAPYIATFPTRFTIPVCYDSIEEYDMLQGSIAQIKAAALLLSTARHYCFLWDIIVDLAATNKSFPIAPADFTWERFRWAVSIIMTRQNKIPIGAASCVSEPTAVTSSPDPEADGKAVTHSIALVPLFDALNHESTGKISTDCRPFERIGDKKNDDDDVEDKMKRVTVSADESTTTTDDDAQQGILRCFAMRTFRAKEQIRIFYGKRSDIEFVTFSGFLPKRPEGETLSLDIRLNLNDPLVKIKGMLLFGNAHTTPITLRSPMTVSLRFSPGPNGQPIAKAGLNRLMQILRIVVASKEEVAILLRQRKTSDGTDVGSTPLNEVNEKRANVTLRDVCKRRLTLYPTTFEETTSILKRVATATLSGDVTVDGIFEIRRRRVALELRHREQSLLTRLQRFAHENA